MQKPKISIDSVLLNARSSLDVVYTTLSDAIIQLTNKVGDQRNEIETLKKEIADLKKKKKK